jgi:phosphonate dehydrogenase
MTDRTVFTPHLGSAVDKGRREIALSAARAIADVLAGKPPADAVAIALQVPSTPHSI